MPTYNPKRSPGKYPAVYHRALERVIGGQLGLTYETLLKVDVSGRQAKVSLYVSSFKASLRMYPLYRLSELVDSITTRVREEPLGDGTSKYWLGVTQYPKVSSLLVNLTE